MMFNDNFMENKVENETLMILMLKKHNFRVQS